MRDWNVKAPFNVRQSLTGRSQSIAIGGLLAIIALIIHAPAQAEWCAEYSYGGRNCGFSTHAQCLATISGVGGSCSGTSDAPSPGSSARKRTRKATTEPKSKPAPEKVQAVREPAVSATSKSKPVPPTPGSAPAAVAAQAAANATRDFANARQLILSGQFEVGSAAMRALNLDSEPDVATYIGLAQHKLGRIDDARAWYDRALKADPNHKLTLSFYGMLRAEQGDVPGAQADLNHIGKLCGGTQCNEYRALQSVISSKTR